MATSHILAQTRHGSGCVNEVWGFVALGTSTVENLSVAIAVVQREIFSLVTESQALKVR